MTSLTENNTTFTLSYDLLYNLTATIASYGYDEDGLRVTKTAGGVITVYHRGKLTARN